MPTVVAVYLCLLTSTFCSVFSAGIQISQKIKSTYKTSTSKIANTFKNTSQNGAAQFIRTYAGHTDGVWEVSVSRYGARVIGTASAGNIMGRYSHY